MRTRNIQLLVVIALLIVLNIWLAMRVPDTSRLDYDEDRFAISDISQWESIRMIDVNDEILLTTGDSWTLNGKYKVDSDIFGLFQAIFSEIRISRKISQAELDEIIQNGEQLADVKFQHIQGDEISFQVFSNAVGTQTLFVEGEEGFEIEIPGYADPVSTVFRLTVDQWRDRQIFDGNWRTIQAMTLEYLDAGERVSIVFKNDFFEIAGLNDIDSNAVVGFLNEFEGLRANERFNTGKFERFDSLVMTSPELVITIDDIKYSGLDSIKIFPLLPGDQLRLVVDPDNDMTVFEERRISSLMKKTGDFSN